MLAGTHPAMVDRHRSSDVRIARIAIGIIVAFFAALAIFVYALRSVFTVVGQTMRNDHVLNVGQTGTLDAVGQCFDTFAHFDAYQHAALHGDFHTAQRLSSTFHYFPVGTRVRALEARTGFVKPSAVHIRVEPGTSSGQDCWMIDMMFFKDVRP